MKLFLFDIDGTLLSAGPSPERAFQAAFEEQYGLADSWKNTQPHGRTDPDIVQEICVRMLGREVSEKEYEDLTDRYAELLEDEIRECSKYRLLPGVLELCGRLSEANDVGMGIETGNVETTARIKLRRGDIEKFFSFGGFASDSSERPEIVRIAVARAKSLYNLGEINPAKDVVIIGDAPQDVQAGRSLGAKTIAVSTGRHSSAVLQKECPDHVMESLEDLEGFLQASSLL